jgi:hypothetical protein
MAWPDGGSLADQPALIVKVFDMITEQAQLEAESEKLKS